MDAEQARSILRKLPHAVETMQWGANLVYWVGDKAVGGKMFALLNLDEDKDPAKPSPVLSFYAGPERYPELLETEGVVPAPYMARIYWVALTAWNVVRPGELRTLLQDAQAGVEARLPKRTRAVLALPAPARNKLIEERRQLQRERVSKERTDKKPELDVRKVPSKGTKAPTSRSASRQPLHHA